MSYRIPVLAVSHGSPAFFEDLTAKLANHGLEATFTSFSHLPSVETVKRDYAALVIFIDQSARIQQNRVKKLADEAGLPCLSLQRQISHGLDQIRQLFPPATVGNGTAHLSWLCKELKDNNRPVGWLRAHLRTPWLEDRSPGFDFVQKIEDFTAWLFRQPPENLPEELRNRRKDPLPPPPSAKKPLTGPKPAPVAEPSTPSAEAADLAKQLLQANEEYALLKAEYDRVVADLVRSKENERVLSANEAAAQTNIRELSQQLLQEQARAAREAQSWEEQGERKARETYTVLVDGLKGQVSKLQNELQEMDEAIAAETARADHCEATMDAVAKQRDMALDKLKGNPSWSSALQTRYREGLETFKLLAHPEAGCVLQMIELLGGRTR